MTEIEDPAGPNADKARLMATRAHACQSDKASLAYIEHPRRVVGHLVAPSPAEATVAWLHDVVEDTGVTLDEVEQEFGTQVAAAVDAMSHRVGEPILADYDRVKANPLALTVKTADLADNTDPERLRLLAPALRDRLEAKYARAREALGIRT